MNENIIVLTDKELEVLKSILGIELYDHLSDDEIEIWKDIQSKVF
jgi:hypothetical protein